MESMHISWLAQIAASQARIAGMQAANQLREVSGASPAYGEAAFEVEAINLDHIAVSARLAAG